MDELLREMGKRISMRRKQLSLTQEELAEKAGLTSQTISTAKTGSKALRPANIVKLCGALEISADYLLFGKTSAMDYGIMSQKVSQLPPTLYRHLEDIINSFLAAFAAENEDNKPNQ